MNDIVDPFQQAATLVLDQEGGYSDDRGDPGNYTPAGVFKGTKYGISARSYPNEDIINLTLERALYLYKRDYWDSLRLGEIPWPLSLYVFDSAVNQGTVPATRMLQEALGVTVDGVIGDETIAAAQQAMPYHAAQFMALRAMRYTQSNNFDRYGKTWLRRVFQIIMEA